jgi:Mlc titration factor MtfA (ptsG expression regulator)
MIFRWLRRRRRRKLLAEPFPAEWHAILKHNVWRYAYLTPEQQSKVRDDLRVLVAEKNWEGCGGLAMSDEIRVTVAAQIALLVLGFQEQYFDHVQSILVYPDAYVARDTTIAHGNLVLEGDSAREGEAWYRGPVILSWAEVLASGQHAGGADNLVCHEFAHQLDMLNGRHVDGTPPLESADQLRRWTTVVGRHYRRLVRDCENGRRTLLDCYGATHVGEFFAVATETFFERPLALQQHHPELYDVLRNYYRQDPAALTLD